MIPADDIDVKVLQAYIHLQLFSTLDHRLLKAQDRCTSTGISIEAA